MGEDNSPAEEPPAVDATEVIDVVALQRLRDIDSPLDPQFLSKLVSMYLQQTPELAQKISAAFRRNDLPHMRQCAHQLCGASLNLGVRQVTAISREIEIRGNEGSTAGVAQLIARLEVACRVAEKELGALLG